MILKVKVVVDKDGKEKIVFSFSEDETVEGEVIAEKEVELNGEGGVYIEVSGDSEEDIKVRRVRELKVDPEVLKELENLKSESLNQDEVN